MSLDSAVLNPYLAPKCRPDQPTFCEYGYSVYVASGSPFYRKLVVSGPVPCIIEYSGSGMGYEVVRVNRTRVYRVSNLVIFGPTLTPQVDFEIPTLRGPVPACLEVKSFLLTFIGALRLTINGQCIYTEGRWRDSANPRSAPRVNRNGVTGRDRHGLAVSMV